MKVIFSLILLLSFFNLASAEEKKKIEVCPKTKMSDRCLDCHVIPDFRLKEIRPDAHLDYPTGVIILNYGQPKAQGYFELTDISNQSANQIKNYFRYLERHKINYAVIELFSPGGNLFAGWKIKGLIDEWKTSGRICETVTHGIAASAGAIVFAAGSEGYRKMNTRAELMFHELTSFKLIDISTPSDKEDEARILRHLQDTITSWLAKRAKLSKEELDTRMKKKEFWINGIEAKEIGFADKLIGD